MEALSLKIVRTESVESLKYLLDEEGEVDAAVAAAEDEVALESEVVEAVEVEVAEATEGVEALPQ
jgi:hypothetical protein